MLRTAGTYGGEGALGTVRVRLDGDVFCARGRDDGTEFGFGEHLLPRIGLGRAGTFGGVHLNPIDATREVRFDDSRESVGRGHAPQQVSEARMIEKGFLGNEGTHVVARRRQVRSGHGPLLDQLTHADVAVVGHPCAPGSGHATFQCGAHRSQVRDVDMSVDQAGHEIPSTQIKRFCGRRDDTRADRLDPATAQDDGDVALDGTIGHVDDVSVGQRSGVDCRRLCTQSEGDEGSNDESGNA